MAYSAGLDNVSHCMTDCEGSCDSVSSVSGLHPGAADQPLPLWLRGLCWARVVLGTPEAGVE